MQEAEAVQAEIVKATREAQEIRRLVDEQLAQLAAREANLKQELARLTSNREELALAVGEPARGRYERLLRNKGESVVVGVQHAVCGGCHMRLPPQLIVSCQAVKELITCPNCGRILYYSRDMDMAIAD